MQNQFYVYTYLNPMKSGNFNYGPYHFNFEPFYVGKGQNGRMYGYLTNYSLKKNTHKNNTIKEILRSISIEEFKSKYIIVQRVELLECQAFKIEIDMIKVIGRRNKSVGPLTNITPGGNGSSGFIDRKCSEETREKLSILFSGKNNPMYNSKRFGEDNPFYNKHHTKDTKEKLRQLNIDKKHSEETKKKMSKSQTGRKHSEETKRKMRISAKNSNKIILRGKDHPKSKPIIIDDIKYSTTREACKKLHIGYHKLQILKEK